MREALELAKKGLGWTQPNPCVGAVIVRGAEKLGEGWHRRAGMPHAEIEAIHDALKKRHSLKNATLYITLEPCSTWGRTPPCVKAIIQHGFSRVVVGADDPNPIHSKRAYKILKKAGIQITRSVLKKECEELICAFRRWITTEKPWVITKAAMTLDGYLSMPKKKWLTGKKSDKQVHQLRSICGAILVGAETVRKDNPRLTVRGVKCLRQPWRVVVTRSGKLPLHARLLTDAYQDRTLVFKNKSWNFILKSLGKLGVKRLLVEGGGKTFESLVKAKLIDEVWIYYTPFVAGKNNLPRADALKRLRLKDVRVSKTGKDICVHGYVSSNICQ